MASKGREQNEKEKGSVSVNDYGRHMLWQDEKKQKGSVLQPVKAVSKMKTAREEKESVSVNDYGRHML